MRIGGQRLVAEHQPTVGSVPELQFGIGQHDASLAGDQFGPRIDRQGQGSQLPGQLGANQVDELGEGDVLVMIARSGLAGRGQLFVRYRKDLLLRW